MRWNPSPLSQFKKRWGKSATELKKTDKPPHCPDIWELYDENGKPGDIAIIGRDMTEEFKNRLPEGVYIAEDERLVVIPREMMLSAKVDIDEAIVI